MPPKASERSTLKRGRPSTGDCQDDQKKVRRSERLGSQVQQTPLKNNGDGYLPSPLTHNESTATEERDVTASPPPGRPSQAPPKSSQGSPLHYTQGGLSSPPPTDTQAFSQFIVPPKTFSHEVEDEEAEGVWGYLVPIDDVFGETLVLKERSVCPAPHPDGDFGKGSSKRGRCESTTNYVMEEKQYENLKQKDGFPSAGYLIGRHPECDRKLELPTISNRHCLVFSSSKNGKSVAMVEDLSSNGTFVNGALVGRNKQRELENADEISILDQARFMFYYPQTRESNGFDQEYRILSQLGKGHFATVYLCVERSSGTQYAVKKFERRRKANPASQTDGLNQEIGVLRSVSHPNVLCLRDTFDEDDGVYLVLQLAPEGELFNYIVMNQKLSEEQTRNVFIQLFQGIKYLHERNIVHRDIKPENILLMDKNLDVKLADFGLAKIIGDESFTTTLCGTPSYVAPEILENSRHRKYTRAVDVWSLGVVLYICLCGFPPFSDELYSKENPYNLSQQIKMGRFDYPSPYWDSIGDLALDLIDKMLTVDADERITIDECLEHPWMQTRSTAAISSVSDSTDGLTGAMLTLDFSKRKPHRERTLLSDLNDVKITKVIAPGPPAVFHAAGAQAQADSYSRGKDEPVKIYDKNPKGKIGHGTVAAQQPQNGTAGKDPDVTTGGKPHNGDEATAQATPAAGVKPEVFMELGGKGDQQLFDNDHSSRYNPGEVPKP